MIKRCIIIIVYDFEVFKHDWMVCWLDTQTKKIHHIVNDKAKFEKFYEYYKYRIWVGYNSRGYDQWIAKAILCDFDPYHMSQWIIEKERKGFEYSNLLNKFPILNYDCSVGFRGLKELEAFMGHDIQETSVPFNINRKLTPAEIQETLKYCKHDVMETFHVFVETKTEFESHVGLVQEFDLPFNNINKTKAQLSAEILGAEKVDRDDEFDICLPDNFILGQYAWIEQHFINWAKNIRNYEEITLKTDICGVPHTFGVGGIHGSKDKYFGEGYYLMADVGSYYPAGMIEYEYLSRNVKNPMKFRQIRDERIVMKRAKDPRQQPRKIVLNGTFGASKDKYNKLYDPLQANNLCIANQLFIVDLLEKLEGKCELIQSNTDGILVKLFRKEDKDMIIGICEEWCKRTRFELEYDEYVKVIQKDVNNYIIVDKDGKCKRKGAYVKKLSPLDNDMPIVNKAIVDYFLYNTPVEKTVRNSNKLIDFQKITKISSKYEYGFKEDVNGELHNFSVPKTDKFGNAYNENRNYTGYVVTDKVYRCFASLDSKDGSLFKKHKGKTTLDKTGGTPVNCFIDNTDITAKTIPSKLDKQWYIDVAKQRIKDFIGGN